MDLEESLAADERAMERIASSLESIAESFGQWVTLQQARFEKEYPVRVSRDALITHTPSPEEELKEAQGSSDEPIDRWIDIGSAEEKFLRENAVRPDAAPKRRSPRPPKSKA